MDRVTTSDFYADDVGEAEAHLNARFGSLDLSTGAVAFGETLRGDAAVTLVRHEFGGRVAVGGEVETFSVATPLDGAAFAWEVGDERDHGFGQPLLLQPGVSFVTRLEDASLRGATFARDELVRTARALFAVDVIDLRFASSRPRTPALGRIWAGLVDLATQRDDAAYALEHASIRSALTRLLFEAFPLAVPAIAPRVSPLTRWLGYRRATAFIDDNASLPVSVADIALASGLSARDLDLAFRLHSRDGGSPRDRLRRVRLEAARADLRTADPAATSIAEIARRWGFVTPRRFVVHYRDAFGVDPFEELLRRS